MIEWRPVADAPRDGTTILGRIKPIMDDRPIVASVRYYHNRQEWQSEWELRDFTWANGHDDCEIDGWYPHPT